MTQEEFDEKYKNVDIGLAIAKAFCYVLPNTQFHHYDENKNEVISKYEGEEWITKPKHLDNQ